MQPSQYLFTPMNQAQELLAELPNVARTHFEQKIAACVGDQRAAREAYNAQQREQREQRERANGDSPPPFDPEAFADLFRTTIYSVAPTLDCYSQYLPEIRRAHAQEVGEKTSHEVLEEELRREVATGGTGQPSPTQQKATRWGLIGALSGTFLASRQDASLPTGAILGGIAGVVASRMDTGL